MNDLTGPYKREIRIDGSFLMRGIFYKGLTLFFALALGLSVATWLSARQKLQAVTVANTSLRKTLGEMAVAIAEKDREIDRLAAPPCNSGKSQVGPGSAAAPRTGLLR
jgi:hypothetical protein